MRRILMRPDMESEVRRILLPICLDQSELVEVRTAAFIIAMATHPTPSHIMACASTLNRDKSLQVRT